LAYSYLGEQEVKNITRPIRIYVVKLAVDVTESGMDKKYEAPAKPSIAVLPFLNMSGDVEQEYFSDGITEDIITALSKFRWFFVIARISIGRDETRPAKRRTQFGCLGLHHESQLIPWSIYER